MKAKDFFKNVLNFFTRSVQYEGDKMLVSLRMNPATFAVEAGFRVDLSLFFSFEAQLAVGPFSFQLIYDNI